jgi:hypothetical protein
MTKQSALSRRHHAALIANRRLRAEKLALTQRVAELTHTLEQRILEVSALRAELERNTLSPNFIQEFKFHRNALTVEISAIHTRQKHFETTLERILERLPYSRDENDDNDDNPALPPTKAEDLDSLQIIGRATVKLQAAAAIYAAAYPQSLPAEAGPHSP